jgi:putative endonuclease
MNRLKTDNKSLGPQGEDLAIKYLQAKGLKIILRNYKTPIGEADIVAHDKDTIVFVEVKTRSSSQFGEPFEAVNERKRDKLKKIAMYYQKQQGKEIMVRFDVVSIKRKADGYEINHITDAF